MSLPPLPPDPRVAAVIVAAGKGERAGQSLPKQFAQYRGQAVVRQAAAALLKAEVGSVCVVIPAGREELAEKSLSGLERTHITVGGSTRQQSVLNGLRSIDTDYFDIVLIHDAARPDCPCEVVTRLIDALKDAEGAIPVLPVIDSMIIADGDYMGADAKRESMRRVQTPQAFRFKAILAAHDQWQSDLQAGDDAQVLRAAGGEVALVPGDERLHKLTFAKDFTIEHSAEPLPLRVGTGYDVHRLAPDEEMWLCGVQIDHPAGLSGHSDADVGLHAVVDAILGAIAQGDIGQHFPPSDQQWKGAPSSRFVEHAVKLADEAGWRIGNVDLTLICEAPKIGPHRDAMRSNLAGMLGIPISSVSVKATTTERLGFTGRAEGIAAQAIASLVAITQRS
ncbi:bifunctional 2-C-methyl-D-erythritol 4-phosphate cytidylyltransferase/2-C-methyl-D-erythritol 2, 4-cyclodiphosphate synthase protein [Aurantiacibacter atlanticus]|uniref:Bifunctional enzyme IspD/IspF n=1 Tax=Aurantiacibacter atlanticus TaxID=1648404 RepID=A0A0H4VD92_9SPHN|nr:bifunctional 2-C-methyl-D-erythritol 4-phosphate cytidylyltransferase/2-C-methyl-D-erythritol 2,4-cyclodiphosphate synthase [Aurantiacibacter atlanticus]AKQ42310.1 bifunctional 2-C-methyl-D-erythritol 4-phosphate cytidylyltransferase/2-C-methyl-D-erythritol 2, 4-cyclodiphosphate synthase protein [Aurantiacibacter atlanticus]MDF1834817.1 bifunctional 2-C-methyl-D-erythritol 4-phosphate cytidylyltransferase/2-C-methyl-D-erythritol 2,4-cyclodiphosphate synthase [Alteraurantiacibacter sp. bin_em_o